MTLFCVVPGALEFSGACFRRHPGTSGRFVFGCCLLGKTSALAAYVDLFFCSFLAIQCPTPPEPHPQAAALPGCGLLRGSPQSRAEHLAAVLFQRKIWRKVTANPKFIQLLHPWLKACGCKFLCTACVFHEERTSSEASKDDCDREVESATSRRAPQNGQ